VFEWLATFNCPVIICGDFNIHVDRDNDVHGAHLADVLQLFDYVQHVTGPTHKLGHTLETRPESRECVRPESTSPE